MNINNIDAYYSLLKHLSDESKLLIINKLSDELINKEPKSKSSISRLFGSFKSEESAGEIVKNLRKARRSKRKIEL